MLNNLDTALGLIFGHEGTFSNRDRKADPGGATMYGITAAVLGRYRNLGRDATPEETKALGRDEARAIVIAYYARPVRFNDLPPGADYAVLDFAVNSGPGQAVRSAQKVVGVRQDGVMGLQTVAAIEQYGATRFVQDYCAERLAFMKRLKNWKQNARGWTIRVTGKDPLGQWSDKPGVVGYGSRMAAKIRLAAITSGDDNSAEVGGDAKADPMRVGLLSTTTGQGAALTSGGTVATILGQAQDTVDQIKAPLEPLFGTMAIVDTLLTGLTVVGALLLIAGVAYTVYGKFRNIQAGVPA
jgi:lysozyme family protein